MPSTPTTSGSAPIQHPVYTTWAPVWRKLAHVYDGSGGFLDGSYLVAHPREWKDWLSNTPSIPTKKLVARRTLARYENVARTLLDQKRSALFRETISRTIGGDTAKDRAPHALETWWENVDGAGTPIDDWMADAFTWAALFGHTVHLFDLPTGATPLTAADQAQPFLRLYTPLDVPDWRLDDLGRFLAIRVLEAVQADDPEKPHVTGLYRERLITTTEWKVFERAKLNRPLKEVEQGAHPFGVVPVVVQYAKGKRLAQLIGQSVLGDPMLYVDFYNITSEIRELLRNQTFGILNVTLGTGDQATDVLKAQAMLGDEKGAENVMFTPGPASYIQPDSTNVTVYQDERTQLLRTIYRLAAIPWESDSKDAEAEGSLKLKREDMNQVLAAYADECEKAEYAIAKLWFRATYGDSWEQEWDRAEVVIRYADSFDVTPFAELLEQVQASTTLPMGPTFVAEQCKRMVPKFMPDLPPKVKQDIEAEIDEHAKAESDIDKRKAEAEVAAIGQPAEGFAA